MINIDQSPIGRTPRSNPATYVGLFTPVRELFAAGPRGADARLQAGALQLQRQGRALRVLRGRRRDQDRDALPARRLRHLRRLRRRALQPRDAGDPLQGPHIAEVLDMTVHQALEFYDAVPQVREKLQTLYDVGLGYIRLGQAATTLLRRRGAAHQAGQGAVATGHRPDGLPAGRADHGLHFDDIKKLLGVLNRLVDQGNTVIVIEHNLDVIKTADWVVDLGPEGGASGGRLIAEGTPEEVAKTRGSYTGRTSSRPRCAERAAVARLVSSSWAPPRPRRKDPAPARRGSSPRRSRSGRSSRAGRSPWSASCSRPTLSRLINSVISPWATPLRR